jgi:hypothetical protein
MNIQGNENNFELFIYNHIGEIVYSQKNLQPNNEYPISLGKNANGIYFAEIKQNNQLISTQKIVLNR